MRNRTDVHPLLTGINGVILSCRRNPGAGNNLRHFRILGAWHASCYYSGMPQASLNVPAAASFNGRRVGTLAGTGYEKVSRHKNATLGRDTLPPASRADKTSCPTERRTMRRDLSHLTPDERRALMLEEKRAWNRAHSSSAKVADPLAGGKEPFNQDRVNMAVAVLTPFLSADTLARVEVDLQAEVVKALQARREALQARMEADRKALEALNASDPSLPVNGSAPVTRS